MKKQIRLNAFAMNCVAHQSPGLWTHPRDRTLDYNRLPYWLDLAKTLERGRFDGLFLADVLGVYDVYGSSPDAAPARTSRPRMTTATRSPTNIWRWSTSFGKAVGKTKPCCATARAAFLRT